MKIFESIINKNDLVFDVGSNMGNKSETFLNLGAKVIGFEPQSECFEQLINKFNGNLNFIAENIALSNKEGNEIMYKASYHTISSMSKEFIVEAKKERFPSYNWDNQIIVKTKTLDSVINEYGVPSFIKIDVEGYELSVLEGLTRPIECISVEFNPELCNSSIECIEYVDKLNDSKSLFNYGYREDDFFKYDNWISKDEIIEYLKSVNDFVFEFGDIYIKKVN